MASKKTIVEGKIVEVFIKSKTYWLQGNWQWNLHCDAIFCSDIILSLPASFSGTGGIIHPDDLAYLNEKLLLLQQAKSISLQFRIITTYGEIKTLNGGSVFLTAEGRAMSEQITESELFKELRLIQLQKKLDHYRAQNEIMNTAERLNAVGTWYFNTATHMTWFSDNVYRIYGIPPQGLNAHLYTFTPFIHPDDRTVMTDAFDKAYKEQVPLHLQFRIISADGQEKNIQQGIQWSFSARGERMISGWIKDETEEKLLETRLEDLVNETYFQKQFVHMDEQAASLGHWYINLLTRKVVFSDSCFRLHGLKTRTVTSGFETFIHFVHADDQEKVREAYKKIRNEHTLSELEYRIICTDGKIRYLQQQGKAVVVAGEMVVMGYIQDVTAQKLAEKNIQELRETALLHRFSETEAEGMARLGTWLWEIQTGKIVWSAGLYQLLGYKAGAVELTPKHLQKLVYLDDRKRFSNELDLVIRGEKETEFEFRLMRLGTVRQVKASFKLKDHDGRRFFLGILQDVTTEHEIRRQLNERIQLMELFTENILDRAFITDSNNTILLWNKACEEGYKIKKADAIGKNFFDVFPHLRTEEQFGLFNSVLKSETVNRQQVRANWNNEHYDLRMLPLKNEQGQVFGIMHVLHDVTKEYLLQQNLTERLRFIEDLLAATVDRIVVLDRNMNYQYWNRRAEMYYGIQKEEVIGKNILELSPGFITDPSYGEFRKALKGEAIYIPAAQNLKEKKGYYETYIIPIKNEKEEVTGILWIAHDLSNEWQLHQERLKAAEQLQREHRKLKEAQAIGHVGSFEGDIATMTFHFSDELFRIFGREPQSFRPTIEWVDSVSHPDDVQMIKAIRDKAIAEKSNYEYYRRIYRPGGEMRHLFSRGRVVCDEEGNPVKLAGTVHDITEQKKAEEEIIRLKDSITQKATDKYLRLFNTMEEGFILIELMRNTEGKVVNYKYLEANPAFEKQVGLKPEQVVGNNVLELFPTMDDWWVQTFGEVADRQRSIRFEHYFKENDRWCEVLAYPMWDEQVAVLYNNITERKRREQHQALLSQISKELAALRNIEKTAESIAEKIGGYFGVSWCMFAELTQDFGAAVTSYGWNAKNVPSISGTYRMRDFLSEEQLARHNAGELSIVSDTQADPNVHAETYGALGIRSFVMVPLSRNGQWKFLLSIMYHKPREWRDDEIELIKELTGRIWARLERARAEEALRESDERKAYLLRLTDALRPLSDPIAIQQEALKMAGQYLDLDRVMYSEMDTGLTSYTIHVNYLREGFSPHIGRFPLSAFRRSVQYLQLGKTDIIYDVENEARFSREEKESCLNMNVRSFVVVPLVKNKQWVWNLVAHYSQPRKWTPYEISILEETAERTWAAVERAKAEESLRQSEERLQNFNATLKQQIAERTEELQKSLRLLEHTEELAQIGSWEYELVTERFTWSEGMYHLFGLPQGAKVIPEIYFDFVVDEDRMIAQRIVTNLKKGSAAFEEIVRIKKGSTTCLLKVKGSVVHNETGEPQKIVGVNLDITEVQKAEEKVKESEKLLEQTARATPDAINIFDLTTNQSIHLNGCLAEWTGMTQEEMMRMGYQGRLELVHPEDREKLKTFNNDMVLAQPGETRTIVYRLVSKNGKIIWIRDRTKVFKTDKDGRPTHLLSVLQDFTEEVELRNQLLERTQYAEIIINTSVNRIMLYDRDFNIIAWNRQSEEITGVPKEQAIGKNIFDLFPRVKEDEVLVRAFTDSMAGEYVHLPPKKSTYTDTIYERFYIPVKDEKGSTYAVLNIMHDVSDIVHQKEELKELNKTLEKKNRELEEKNEEISSFAFIASHDLKEPLRKLYTFSDWLLQKEGENLSETGKHYIKKIANSVRRMDMLIEDVLILAKIGSDRGLEMKIDLNAVLERAIGDMKDQIRQKGAEILVEELPVVTGNSNQIFYLFKNLISNAIKFQEPGNQPLLKITAARAEGSQVNNGHSAETGGYYKISFEDNGLGFEQKYSKKIFQVFQRLHGAKEFEGTGMGLAICRKILENHRGFIKVKSEPGKGSVFSCYFPIL